MAEPLRVCARMIERVRRGRALQEYCIIVVSELRFCPGKSKRGYQLAVELYSSENKVIR